MTFLIIVVILLAIQTFLKYEYLDKFIMNETWESNFSTKCPKKEFKKDGDDLLTMSPVSIVLGAILGLFWRYEYKPGWSPEPLLKNNKNKSISTKIKILRTFDPIPLYYPLLRLLIYRNKRENPC
jgi:hypothetical protein